MSTDCIVLKIEEFDNWELDNTIFIIYDKLKSQYLIRGRRSDTDKYNPVPISFIADNIDNLTEFILFILCKSNTYTYSMYNYDNLPDNQYEITYEKLKNLDNNVNYEIVTYTNKKLTKKCLYNMFNILKNIYNNYYII
jgi:hypothetical protein